MLRAGNPLPRRWAPRLSVPTADSPCGRLDSPTELRCSGAHAALPPRVIEVARRAAAAARREVGADALHATALVDLVAADTAGNTLERSISHLEMASRLAPRSASVLTDLSATHLAHASGRGGARALLASLDAATRALELEPRSLPALYNRALTLDLLALDDEATKGWRTYLAVDSRTRYAVEARARLARIAAHAAPQPPEPGAPASSLTDFAVRVPGEARALAWEQLLRDWGDAVLAGDSAGARARLAEVEAVGAALAQRHGDWSTSDAVRSIMRAARATEETRQLASLHSLYARAQARAQVSEYPRADSGFRAILGSRPPSPSLVWWSSLAHANALIYLRRPDDAAAATLALLRAVDAGRHPLLAARGYWIHGVLLLRRARTDAGLESIRRARDLFNRAGDRENVAATLGLEGEAMLQAGGASAAYDLVHRALIELRGHRASIWRHNLLLVLGRAAERAGLRSAARAVEDEDATAAGAGIRAVSVVEARLARARTLWLAGRPDLARAATSEAVRALATVPTGGPREQLSREVDLTTAVGLLRSRPDSARALLDSVVAFFTPLQYAGKLIPALVARAAASIAVGDAASAEVDLARTASIYDAARQEIARAALRATLLAQARAVFEELVMLRLRAGRPADALAALEQARLSFARPGRAAERVGPVGTEARAATATLLDYALIGDTLLIWVVRARDTVFTRARLPRERLVHVAERTRAALELGASDAAIRPDLEQLYEWLVRPVVPYLGDAADRAIVIVADGGLLDLPWAALRDRRSGKYLVEQYVMRLAPSLRDATAASAARPAETPLFVANPALDRRLFPALTSLPGAEGEARALAALYHRASLLGGTAADSAAVVSALRGAGLFHFAGHAVFDDAEPDRSYLAVSPRGLSAATIASLDLRRVRLVVLSACETMRAPDRRSGGFAGLADAFLAAGARGVVGSLWRVDDEATRPLMEQFHQAYRRSWDPAMALREAQLALLRSGSTSPSAWAAFRYAGH